MEHTYHDVKKSVNNPLMSSFCSSANVNSILANSVEKDGIKSLKTNENICFIYYGYQIIYCCSRNIIKKI